MIKTDKPDLTSDVPRGAHHGKRVGRCTKTNIPDHKFTGMIFEPFPQPELVDVERLRLGDRADDRMKRLGIGERAYGADAVVQADELVAGVGLHSSVLRETPAAKRKTGECIRNRRSRI
jgi:hypothetical protein